MYAKIRVCENESQQDTATLECVCVCVPVFQCIFVSRCVACEGEPKAVKFYFLNTF